MVKPVRYALALLMTLVVAVPLAAQEPKAGIVISVASQEKLLAATQEIIQIAGVPAVKSPEEMFNEIVKEATGIKTLAGLDKSKPWGVAVMSAPSMEEVITFAPINDLKAFLEAMPETVKKTDEGDGVTRVSRTDGPGEFCMKGANGWVYAASQPAQLKTLPADPAALLGDLPQRYLMAVRVKMANITPEQRKAVWSNLGNLAPPDALEKVQAGIEQLDELTIGWKVDAAAKQVIAEVTVSAVAGSQLAAMAPRLADRATKFAGLRSPDAALSFASTVEGELTPAELDQLKKTHEEALKQALEQIDMEGAIPGESKPVVKEAISTLLSVWFDTQKSGKQDGGFAVFTAPKPAMVAGGSVSDGDALLTALKRLATLIDEKDPNAPEITWDAGEHGGHKLHMLKFKFPPNAPVPPVLGDGLELVVAVSKPSVLFALGPDATTALKKVIDAGPGADKVPAVAMVVRVKMLLDLAGKMGAGPFIQPLAQQMAALKPGADEAVVTSVPLDHGVTFRLTLNEGVLKAIASGVMIGQQMRQPKFAPPPAAGPGGDF